jgi:Family of unknown function (DUF6491)
MRKIIPTLLGVALFGVLAADAAALEQPARPSARAACLQNNRIWNWRVINERTLIVADRNYRPFEVRLSGGCVGLTDATLALRFNTFTNLGCLRRGDRVSFRAPALGRMSCFVQAVRPLPPQPPGVNNRDLRYYDPRFAHEYDRYNDRRDRNDDDRDP